MRNLKKEKGITLIALIITIIVMLILVAVTISVALNGGIFTKGREAANSTQRWTDKERLIGIMVGAYNENGKFDVQNVEFSNKAKWCTKNDETFSDTEEIEPTGQGDWVITENNNKFYIDSDGSVLDDEIKINYWKKWGLTSDNVKYGSLYTPNDEVLLSLELIIQLNEDGSIYLGWDDKTYPRETAEYVVENSTTEGIFLDGNKMYFVIGGGLSLALEFEKNGDTNYANMYLLQTEYVDVNDLYGSMIENNELAGIATAE